jgi:hypothetical protein
MEAPGGRTYLVQQARPEAAGMSSHKIVGLNYRKAKKTRSLRGDLQKTGALKY